MSKISIPELDSLGITSSEFLRMLNGMCELYLEKIAERYPSNSVDDIAGYVRQICSKIVKMSRTLEVVAGQEHDYVVSNSIVRSIADNMASLLFVYERDADEMVIRHLLFVMDGVDSRLQMKLKRPLKKDGRISQTEFDALKQQIESAIENERGCIEYCENAIRGMKYYSKNSEQCEALIKQRNWKYDDINQPKHKISWEKMYNILKFRDNDIFPFLSQYVHGLSVSNIIVPYSEDDFQPIWTFGVALIGRMREFMEGFYHVQINDIGIDISRLFEMVPRNYWENLIERRNNDSYRR